MSDPQKLTEQMLQLKRGTEEFAAARRVATLPDCGAALYEPAEHPKCAIAQMCKSVARERSVTCAVAAAVANVAAAFTGSSSGGVSSSFGPGGGGEGAIGSSVLHGPPSVRDVLKAALCPSARAEMLAAARAAHAHHHHHDVDAPSPAAPPAPSSEATMGGKVGSHDTLPSMLRDASSSTTMGHAAALPTRRSSHKHNLFASVSDFGDRVLSHVFGGPSPHHRRVQPHHEHDRTHASRRSPVQQTRTAEPSAADFDEPSVSTTAMRGDDSPARVSRHGSDRSGGSDGDGNGRRTRPSRSRGAASAGAPVARASAAHSARSTATTSGASRTHFMPHATLMFDPFVAAATGAAAASERRREARQRERDRRANEFAADICIFENNEDTQRAYIEEVAESVFQALHAEAANEFGKLRSAQWWDGRKETLTERMTKHVMETYFRRMHGYARQNFRFLFAATSEGVPKPWNFHQNRHHHQRPHHHHHHEHRRFHLRHDARGGIVASPEEIACATHVARACGAQLVVDMALTDDDESSMDFLVLPGQRISLANCPADKLYMYYAFMAFKSHKEAFSTPESLAAFREAARDVFLDPEGPNAHRHLCTLQAAQMFGRATCGASCGDAASPVCNEVSVTELEDRCFSDAATRSALGRRVALLALRHAMDMISASAYFPRLSLELYARVISLESHLRTDDIEGAGVELLVGGATNAGLGGCIAAAARNRAARDLHDMGHEERDQHHMSFAVDGADASFGRALTPAPSVVFQPGDATGGDAATTAEQQQQQRLYPAGVAAPDGVSTDGAGPQGTSDAGASGALIARTLSVFRGADDAANDSAGEPFSPSSAAASPTAPHSASSTFDPSRVSTTAAFATSPAPQAQAGKAAIAAPAHHHRARAASATTPVDLSASTMSSRTKSAAHHRDANRAALPEHMRLLIGDVLGKGATGCVYAAMCTDTSRMLALKEMRIRDVTRTAARARGGRDAAPAPAKQAVATTTPSAITPATAAAPAVAVPAIRADVAAPHGGSQRETTYDSSDEEVPNVDTLGLTTGAFDLQTPGTSLPPTFGGVDHAPPQPPAVARPATAPTAGEQPAQHSGCAAGLRPLSFHHSTEESLIPKALPAPTHTEVCMGADDVTYSPTMDTSSMVPTYDQQSSPASGVPSPAAAPKQDDSVAAPEQPQQQAQPAFAAPPKLPLEEEGMLTITQDSATTSESGSSRRNEERSSGSETDTEGPEGDHRSRRRASTSIDNTTSTAQRTASTTGGTASTAPAAVGALVPTTTGTGVVAALASSSRALRNAGATAVAITEEEQRVVDEINLLRRLRHENIVAYLGCKWDRLHGVVYIVMELCPHSLRDIRKSLKSMPLSLIAHYARGVLSGLRYLHDQHIVHRDIKAANILVTDQGVVKVSDFGVSVTVADDEDDAGDAAGLGESENVGAGGLLSANAIKRRTLCGTPCFIAPELFNGASCSEASDIWSFGCLMVELASGSSPWWNYPHHNGLWQIARRLRSGVAPSLPKTPAQAAALRLAASATGVAAPMSPTSATGDAAADLSASSAIIGGLSTSVTTNALGQPHPALLDMGAPLTYVEGATEATPAFEDFVAQCLAFDTCRRPSAAALLAHPFLNSRG